MEICQDCKLMKLKLTKLQVCETEAALMKQQFDETVVDQIITS